MAQRSPASEQSAEAKEFCRFSGTTAPAELRSASCQKSVQPLVAALHMAVQDVDTEAAQLLAGAREAGRLP